MRLQDSTPALRSALWTSSSEVKSSPILWSLNLSFLESKVVEPPLGVPRNDVDAPIGRGYLCPPLANDLQELNFSTTIITNKASAARSTAQYDQPQRQQGRTWAPVGAERTLMLVLCFPRVFGELLCVAAAPRHHGVSWMLSDTDLRGAMCAAH